MSARAGYLGSGTFALIDGAGSCTSGLRILVCGPFGLEGITGEMVDAANLGDHTQELFWANPHMPVEDVQQAFTGGGGAVEAIANPGDEEVPGWEALPAGFDKSMQTLRLPRFAQVYRPD